MKRTTFQQLCGAALALVLAAGYAWAAAEPQAPAATGVPIRITVTAVAKHKGGEPPALSKQDFLVYQSHERRAVLDAVRQSGENNKLDLCILVDEAIESDVTLDYRDINSFVRGLPPTVRVGIFYALNGTVSNTQDLTENHDAALKALRIPLGRIGAGGGIYLSVADLAKRLTPAPDRRRAIVFLSSGIDLYRGVGDMTPGLNPDLETAIHYLNRNNITVYPIYVEPVAHFARSLYLVTNGQSCLSYLGDETGGEAYFQGMNTPVSMTPFLEDLSHHLNNQYLVTFAAKPGKKPGFSHLHVTTEVSGVEVTGPNNVYVPVEK